MKHHNPRRHPNPVYASTRELCPKCATGAEWRADKSLPPGSKSEALIQNVIGKLLTKNWYEGLDLAAVLEQCRQTAQKGVSA